jgi:hypothetical protein
MEARFTHLDQALVLMLQVEAQHWIQALKMVHQNVQEDWADWAKWALQSQLSVFILADEWLEDGDSCVCQLGSLPGAL